MRIDVRALRCCALLLCGCIALAVGRANADVLVQDTAGNQVATFAPGQSVTTPTGGPFDQITFNWFDANKAPVAGGTLFLLSQAYTGKAGDLSSSTTGFLASSLSIVSNEYQFDPSVTLLGNTQYFFFTNVNLTTSGD